MAMREAMKEMQQEVEEVRRTAADERRRLKAEVAAGTPRPDWGRLQLVAGGALTAGLRQKQEAEHKAQMTQGVRDGGAGASPRHARRCAGSGVRACVRAAPRGGRRSRRSSVGRCRALQAGAS